MPGGAEFCPQGWPRRGTVPATVTLPRPQQPDWHRDWQQRLPVQLELDELPKAATVVIPQCARVPYRSHLVFTESPGAKVASGLLGPGLYPQVT